LHIRQECVAWDAEKQQINLPPVDALATAAVRQWPLLLHLLLLVLAACCCCQATDLASFPSKSGEASDDAGSLYLASFPCCLVLVVRISAGALAFRILLIAQPSQKA